MTSLRLQRALEGLDTLHSISPIPETDLTDFETPMLPTTNRRKSVPLPSPPRHMEENEERTMPIESIRAILAKARGENINTIKRKPVPSLIPTTTTDGSETPNYVQVDVEGTDTLFSGTPESPKEEGRPLSSDEFAEMLMREIERKLEAGEVAGSEVGAGGGGEGEVRDREEGKEGKRKRFLVGGLEVLVPKGVWERMRRREGKEVLVG